jgi:hypothetical protein
MHSTCLVVAAERDWTARFQLCPAVHPPRALGVRRDRRRERTVCGRGPRTAEVPFNLSGVDVTEDMGPFEIAPGTQSFHDDFPPSARRHLVCRVVSEIVPITQKHDIEGLVMGVDPG